MSAWEGDAPSPPAAPGCGWSGAAEWAEALKACGGAAAADDEQMLPLIQKAPRPMDVTKAEAKVFIQTLRRNRDNLVVCSWIGLKRHVKLDAL